MRCRVLCVVGGSRRLLALSTFFPALRIPSPVERYSNMPQVSADLYVPIRIAPMTGVSVDLKQVQYVEKNDFTNCWWMDIQGTTVAHHLVCGQAIALVREPRCVLVFLDINSFLPNADSSCRCRALLETYPDQKAKEPIPEVTSPSCVGRTCGT